MSAFTLQTFEGVDPAYLTEVDRDLYTAQHWTLHLHTDMPNMLAADFRATGAEVLTGDFVGGDSFRQWCETSDDGDNDQALHVYFTASTLEQAVRTAEALCAAVGITSPTAVALSTAGDWAEQSPIWRAA